MALQQPLPRPVSACPDMRAASGEFWTVVAALEENVAHTRHLFAEWLGTVGWPAEQRDDMVLAVSEAVTNAIEHAYRPGSEGQVQLYAWDAIDAPLGQRRVVVVVSDRGRWKPAVVDRGYRGHGLAIMAACMDSVHLEPSPGGTTVVMSSKPRRASGLRAS